MILLPFIALILTAQHSFPASRTLDGTVTKVADGDTITVLDVR